MYFGLETYWTLLRKWQALIILVMIYRGLPRYETSWLETDYKFIQVINLKWKTYKLETSQSPEYSERKYYLLLFSLRRSMWFLCQMVMMMTMMMTMINSRVCGENSRCPWKNCAVQGFDCFQKQSCLKLRSQRHGRQLSQTVTLKIAHAEAWNFFCAIFRLTISEYSSQQKDWCSRWVDSCEKQNFL